ncbi:hypothetical protein [Liquorilactobacillus hordei]|uniref:hypothetical protein n=1 Tax=Liquorilactobacillus hordei TaxID=468911 RepID=UPI0039EC5D07
MIRSELIANLKGTEIYVKEPHYSKILNKVVIVEYPIHIVETEKLVDSIPWQGKEIEEILVLVEEYYNN